jgi:hypothetical protein
MSGSQNLDQSNDSICQIIKNQFHLDLLVESSHSNSQLLVQEFEILHSKELREQREHDSVQSIQLFPNFV